MPLYTLEAGGMPILVVAAADSDEARSICDDSMEELLELGVFDEDQETTLRDADKEERAHWEAAIAEAVEEGEVDSREQAEEEAHMVLLVPLADDEDLDEDEE